MTKKKGEEMIKVCGGIRMDTLLTEEELERMRAEKQVMGIHQHWESEEASTHPIEATDQDREEINQDRVKMGLPPIDWETYGKTKLRKSKRNLQTSAAGSFCSTRKKTNNNAEVSNK